MRLERSELHSTLTEQLVCGPGNQFALMTCAGELDGARLALTLSAGNGRGSIGSTADNLIQRHLSLVAVR